MLETQDLSKTYEDGAVALAGLNLAVRPGEIYALLGANGAGKSTTINLLLGFIRPTRGTATIGGLDVVAQSLESRRHVGYIPEDVALYGDLDARTNLRYLGRLAGLRPTPAECDRVLEETGFPREAVGRRARHLSKGMRQKVAIAAIRMKGAELLLLDEPTSGLDPRAAAEFLRLLAQMRAEGRAILLATHDLLRMHPLADRVGIMNAGRLVAERTRQELDRQDLEQVYLGCLERE
ncbi:MAG: ABC transporter ATP-binding protein [Planctomycetes bacterium]|nr:ABC transporter ATP-binding protein [Planctomycetota bacterium]